MEEKMTDKLRPIGKTGLVLLLLSVVFAVGETAYFGFNQEPASLAEYWCDHAAIAMNGAGAGLYLFAIIGDTAIKLRDAMRY